MHCWIICRPDPTGVTGASACPRPSAGAPHDDIDPDSGRITPCALCAAVQRCFERIPSPVVICDGGVFGQWAQAGTRGGRRIINGLSGAIGSGPCYALGAKIAEPEATVVALMGDGTVGFHLAEFETAVRADTPFVAVIGNNGCWNAEHQIQLRNYGADRLVGCDLSGARYDLLSPLLVGTGNMSSGWRIWTPRWSAPRPAARWHA